MPHADRLRRRGMREDTVHDRGRGMPCERAAPMTCKWFVLLILSASCGRIGFDERGDGPPNNIVNAIVPSWQSGTRLRARVAEFGDGNRLLIGWYDTQLATTCQPV